VAAVAAKAIIWVAVGLGMYLLPEATRRGKVGVDARPILRRTLGLIAAAALPMVLIYAVAGKPLLAAVFGDDLTDGSGALAVLGLAMTMLAYAYLSVHYLLALRSVSFVWVLLVAAAAEVLLLIAVGPDLTEVAWRSWWSRAQLRSRCLRCRCASGAPAAPRQRRGYQLSARGLWSPSRRRSRSAPAPAASARRLDSGA
jgi:hypothetical protein